MAKRRLFLIMGMALGACLPGCLRPFGQRQENSDPLPNAPAPTAGGAAIRKEIRNTAAVKKELPGSPTSTLDILMVPTLDEGKTPGPDKKPEIISSLILAGPDLTAAGGPISSVPQPVKKRDFLGQLGPASTAPPNLVEQSEPPPPGVSIRSDYPSKDQLLDVLHYFLADQPEKVIELMNHYDSAKQNIFMTLLPVLAGLSQKPREPLNPKEIELIQDQLESLLDSLRPRSNLSITKMCFCKAIKSYAIYDPWPEDHVFRASSSGHSLDGDVVQVYVELRNFCCERREKYHEIHLSSSVEIRDARDPAAKPMWFKRFDDSKQPPVRSRAELHDYFCRFYFAVPHLPPGEYTMTIQVVDETFPNNKRLAKKSMPIRVSAGHQTAS